MPNWNQVPIEIDLEFGLLDDKIMQVQITANQHRVHIDPVIEHQKGHASFQTVVALPGQVILEFSGKNNNTDTRLDSEGNIVQDLYVKITDVKLDCFKLSNKFKHTHLKLETSDQTICTPYVGFNGRMTINLDKTNIFQQYYAFEG